MEDGRILSVPGYDNQERICKELRRAAEMLAAGRPLKDVMKQSNQPDGPQGVVTPMG